MSRNSAEQKELKGGSSGRSKKNSAAELLLKLMDQSSVAASDVLEMYHYSQEADLKELMVNYANTDGADRFMIYYLAERLTLLNSILKKA